MPTDSHAEEPRRTLPDRPNLRHLKDQARDLMRTGEFRLLSDAQFKIARLYGFESWPKLKAHVASIGPIAQLKYAIDMNDLNSVEQLMTRHPGLHRAPLGHNNNGPLTWVAECRVPWTPPSQLRLDIARWMIEHGSDVHQGGDGPLMRAALQGYRIPMMELLVSFGADVNAEWNGYFPIIFAPCETIEPAAIQWLLDRGADPNCAKQGRKYSGTALDQVIASYARSLQLGACIEILREAGGVTRYDVPPVLDLLSGRIDCLIERLDHDPALRERLFPELDFGATAGRALTLQGGSLLHVAAEYGNIEALTLLLGRGADPNVRAAVDNSGVGGQTPIFHAVTQFGDWGLRAAEILIQHGADLSVRVKIPGHYERPGDLVECTPLGYARLFPGAANKCVPLLEKHGAKE